MARSHDLVPGTVLLALEQNAESVDKSTGVVILVPTPSSDDRDPLRWSRFRKLNHLTLITAWIFFLSAFNNWLGPPIDRIMADTNSNFNQMNVRPILSADYAIFLRARSRLGKRSSSWDKLPPSSF